MLINVQIHLSTTLNEFRSIHPKKKRVLVNKLTQYRGILKTSPQQAIVPTCLQDQQLVYIAGPSSSRLTSFASHSICDMGEISHTSRLGVYKAVLNLTFWQMCKVVKIDTSWLVCPDGFPWQRKVIRVEGIQCTHGACSCKALPIAHKGVDPDPDVEMITNLLVNKLWINLKSLLV